MLNLINGFFVGGSLIVAIGAQNAYVLKSGLLNNHIFFVSLICFICDALLITFGVFGVGELINESRYLLLGITAIGVVFLLWYGTNSFISAYKGNSKLSTQNIENKKSSLKKTVATTLMLTLLNPHVYLDTVVILGGYSSTLDFSSKILFAIGAVTASFTWFFSLGYGAKKLSKLFASPKTWVILDVIIGIIMFSIALSLSSYIASNL